MTSLNKVQDVEPEQKRESGQDFDLASKISMTESQYKNPYIRNNYHGKEAKIDNNKIRFKAFDESLHSAEIKE